jgi:XTP/dITP diphosphohydrolase
MDGVNSLIYVTGNPLKFKVAVRFFEGSRISLESRDLSTPEIQSSRVEEIAEWSAAWACRSLNRPVVVMDAGYYIEALNGFPGPFIKFVNEWFSAEDYLNLMQGKTNRRVVIRDCLAYCRPKEKPAIFSQLHQGQLAARPGRRTGTSIDQIFIPEGFSSPVSEIPPEEMLAYWSDAAIWQQLKMYIEGLVQGS